MFKHLLQSKKEGKDQESIQSSTTPDPGYNGKVTTSQLDITNKAKRSALSQQVTTRHQQTDVHESITKQDKLQIQRSCWVSLFRGES